MSYLLAILGLAAACVVWYWAQRWAGRLDQEDEAGGSECEECELRSESCPVPRKP